MYLSAVGETLAKYIVAVYQKMGTVIPTAVQKG